MREGWKEVKIEELGTIGRGKSKHRPRNANFLFGDKYPFVQTADVKGSEYKIYNYSQMYSEAGLAQSKLWPKGTLCITIAANIADAAILGIDACFPDSVVGFIPNPSKSDVRFVKYLFDLLQVRIKKISQGAAQDNLSLEKIRTLNFQVPPLETQKKIASILSGYDDLIENNLKRIKLLEEMAQQTYEEWFVRMRFPGHDASRASASLNPETGLPKGDALSLPKGWEKVKLGNVADLNKTNLKKGFNGKIKYIDIASVSPNQIGELTEYDFNDAPGRARRVVKNGDIIWSCVRPNRRSHALIINPEENLIASTGFCVISPLKVPFVYLYHALTTDEFVGYLTNLAGGAAYPAVTQNHFEDAEIIIPSKQLLDEFEDKFGNSKYIINNLQNQNQRLREARDILLPRLMMGMIEV